LQVIARTFYAHGDRFYKTVGEHHLLAINIREDRTIGLARPLNEYLRPQMVVFGLQHDRRALRQVGHRDSPLNGSGMLIVFELISLRGLHKINRLDDDRAHRTAANQRLVDDPLAQLGRKSDKNGS
jgi:hypothetical protein